MTKIFINPGHSMSGQPDAGCAYNSLKEYDLNAQVSTALSKELKAQGFECEVFQQTGHNNANAQLNEVPTVANKSKADVFVSIHMNGHTNESANGTETLYMKGSTNGKRLAEYINSKLTERFDEYQLYNRGAKEDTRGLCVLRYTSMPAVLVEVGFISNKSEATFIKNSINAIAKRICQGICKYFNKSYEPDLLKDKPEHTTFKFELVADDKYDLYVDEIKILAANKFDTCLSYLYTHYHV